MPMLRQGLLRYQVFQPRACIRDPHRAWPALRGDPVRHAPSAPAMPSSHGPPSLPAPVLEHTAGPGVGEHATALAQLAPITGIDHPGRHAAG